MRGRTEGLFGPVGTDGILQDALDDSSDVIWMVYNSACDDPNGEGKRYSLDPDRDPTVSDDTSTKPTRKDFVDGSTEGPSSDVESHFASPLLILDEDAESGQETAQLGRYPTIHIRRRYLPLSCASYHHV